MNPFGAFILGALLARYGLELVAGALNLRRLQPTIPAGFEDVYEADAYARSQAYTRARARLDLIESTVGLLALLLFWFLDGFDTLDVWLRSFGWGGVTTGTLFIAILVLASGLLGLPFSIWRTFVIEERFGFNRTTPATFMLDLIKGLGLGLVLGLPVLAGVLWLFLNLSGYAWLLGWGFLAGVTVVLQFVAPRWIFPLFNRFTPLDSGSLRSAIHAYTQSVRFPIQDVYVVDGSRRSGKANAFFTGFGRTRRIALFDTLIDRHPEPEVVAVLAHEVGHQKRGHILKGTVIGIAHLGVLFFLLDFVLESPALFDAFGMQAMSVHAGLIFFSLLYAPAELVLSLLLNALSRRHEFEADAFAAHTTDRPDAMIAALKRLARENLSNLTPHPFYVALHYSHPPLPARIAALEALPDDPPRQPLRSFRYFSHP